VNGNFVWRDAGRVVVFRQDGAGDALQPLREHGFERFELLASERALDGARDLADAAEAVHPVADGEVPQLAGALLSEVAGERLVALGGGRVIDTAKAIASVTGADVAAIPTTLSGAEMTGIHRLPAGAEDRVRSLVRAALVIADPDAMTSLPERRLRASGLHALAHAIDSLYTPFANPVSQLLGLRGAELVATALNVERPERDRAALAQGALLCGYAIDSGSFAVHHVVCQTLVRICGSPHAETNAAVLPRVAAFMVPRAPDNLRSFAAAVGTTPAELEPHLLQLGDDPTGLGDLGADRSKLDDALDSILLRPELAFTPEPPTRLELKKLIEAAW